MKKGFVFSSWINAWTLYRACQDLGLDLYTTDRKPSLPIPTAISQAQNKLSDIVFFTEESSLRKYLTSDLKSYFLPKKFPLDLLDDKLHFAQWLEYKNELTIPFQLFSTQVTSFPVLLKSRYSWHNNKKYPRGWICKNNNELDLQLKQVEQSGYLKEDFFIQKWIDHPKIQIISVCGFFDYENTRRNCLCVVKRVAAHEKNISCSAMVATIPDPADLIQRTESLLSSIQFTGPFELEFIELQNNYYILELNPRFWMQHGLFYLNDNALVKRYLQIDSLNDWKKNAPERLLWIDSVWLFKSILKYPIKIMGKLLFWKLKGYRLIYFPNFYDLIKYIFIYKTKKSGYDESTSVSE